MFCAYFSYLSAQPACGLSLTLRYVIVSFLVSDVLDIMVLILEQM